MRPDVLEFCLENLYWNSDFQGNLMNEVWSAIQTEDSQSRFLLSYFPSRNAKRWLAFNLLRSNNPAIKQQLRKDWAETKWGRPDIDDTKLMLSVEDIPGWEKLGARLEKEE